MKTLQTHYLDKDISIVRPLIFLTKSEIEKSCKLENIPYSIDESNFQTEVSKRNQVRSILENMENKENINKSMTNLYNLLDQREEQLGETRGLLITTKAGERNQHKLYQVYKRYHITINPRQNTLETLSRQLNKA